MSEEIKEELKEETTMDRFNRILSMAIGEAFQPANGEGVTKPKGSYITYDEIQSEIDTLSYCIGNSVPNFIINKLTDTKSKDALAFNHLMNRLIVEMMDNVSETKVKPSK